MFNVEPVRLTSALSVLVNAVIAILVGFSIVSWTDVQIGLVVGLWNAVVGVFLATVVRNKVTPE